MWVGGWVNWGMPEMALRKVERPTWVEVGGWVGGREKTDLGND